MRAIRSMWIDAFVLLLFSPSAFSQALTPIYPNAYLSQGAGCFSSRCFLLLEDFDGTTVINSNTGSGVGVHVRSVGPQWRVVQSFTNPDDPPPPPDITMKPEQIFGSPAAVHGDYMLIAGSSKRYAFKDVVYVYHRENGAWRHTQTFPLQRPTGFDRTLIQDISMHGDTAFISGVRISDTYTRELTRVDVYKRDANGTYGRRDVLRFPAELTEYTNHLLAIDGNIALVSENLHGRVYVFERRPAGWVRARALSSDIGPSTGFGSAVAVSGSTIAIAEPNRPHPTNPQYNGAVNVYSRVNGQWTLVKRIFAPSSADFGYTFASSVALSGDRLLVGTTTNEFSEYTPSFAFLFERRESWPAVATLELNDSLAIVQIALAGSTAILLASDRAYGTPALVFDLPLLWTLPALQ